MPIEVADSSRKRRRFRKHMRTPRPDANSLSGFKAITKTTHVPICNNALDLKHTQTPGRSSTAVVCVPGRVPGLSPNLIVVGVRDVTKHLVRNSLELVMIGEDIRSVMVQHIPTLCGRQKVRCVSLAAPSSDIAGILRVTRATVIGVLRRAASSRPVVSSTLLSPYTTTAKDEIYSSQQLNSWLYKALDQHAAQLSTSL
ncbi:hypothetical protein SARC_06135 [Sphaeroforma arctica JP610]|uniref:Ribosomal protein eL8/eL30/eS12/Gadd45 domain-containing protein n=1 Tax=Sphaeroforma arctica JP610 TaxID=667725 RepID=A0A0L0FXH7_9EUKA|nr:hypothetical protein SARC_06135 [Sphaeroforma arctica JP610]KNC81545.1 hypothetical protein SARC_06135 [Sphaeroforma arctica JP610]|eukprot:XP_014155447.1 hypothetical protein SARC_06135 [Sphaeroforma arctica JP610]